MVFFMLSLVFVSLSMLGFSLYLLLTLLFSCWILPIRAYRKIKKNGFVGPIPSFPMGNIREMKNNSKNYVDDSSLGSSGISHDIHSTVFPYFARWQKSYGKLFIYWLGTEPFLYVAEPEFLRKMSLGVLGKSWGKPKVFKNDREPMFGRGLVMVEGDDWVRHRHVITPAFSPSNLKAMASLMVEPATKMLDRWATLINSGKPEIDVEREITTMAGEIIARTSFGLSYRNGSRVFEKLRAMQITLFNSNRYVGVPFSKWMCPKKNLEAKRLGKEIDQLLLSIIDARKSCWDGSSPQKDLLGLLMDGSHADGRAGKSLTARELVDECKTFFFGGHETTALALTWTLLLLAMYPDWQSQLRDEVRQLIGDGEIDFAKLTDLKKMEWVMKEVLRLYSPAPNAQRQAREDIQVDDLVIPNGTNIWIDVVAMHHDPTIWGDDVNDFRPDRFKNDNLYGGCKHKMGFLPFGFGGRMCVGRNLTMMEYKVVLTLMLTRFSFSLSPSYSHSPSILLSLRPKYGLPLLLVHALFALDIVVLLLDSSHSSLPQVKEEWLVGPTPSFPMGNNREMTNNSKSYVSSGISHDIHSTVFLTLLVGRNLMGTEPFLYVADPEFLKKMSSGVLGKSWGIVKLFKRDREPMFGSGLVMVEGDDWVRHRHLVTPAFSPSNLKALTSLMVEPATNMLDRWATLINSGKSEIDVEREITMTAGEIIAKTSFGLSNRNGSTGSRVFEKLRAMQDTLFNDTNRYAADNRLGKEIDQLLLSIIDARKSCRDGSSPQNDLLSLMMNGDGQAGLSLTTRELIDECKTFFFSGYETTALALTWTMFLLAMYPDWQKPIEGRNKTSVWRWPDRFRKAY
ncbi:hypothetical protein GQ457_17G025340 [Hibiscus cannabinus]